MVEGTVQLSDNTKEKPKKCKIEALKAGLRGAKEMYEENIISAVIHVDETTPHLYCDFVPLTMGNLISMKDG